MPWNAHRDKPKHPVHLKRKLARLGIGLLVWLGLAVVYYTIFSFFFDTPVEHGMKQSIRQLEVQLEKLEQRYDTLERVLNNVSERDHHIFRTLFDSEPLQYDTGERNIQLTDSLLHLSNQQLAETFFRRFERFQARAKAQLEGLEQLQLKLTQQGEEINRIPSIQPVINPDLTQIATSFGMRVHPFYRTMVMHNGMDYAVPEGTRVFATADGTVTTAGSGQSNSGISITIDHGNGYETVYSHLSRTQVRAGTRVRRGDIIAFTGDTGLSLAPHLHYEVLLHGKRVDPVHYFFYELGPVQYEQVKRQAAVGMQSFD
ncbi:MAG: peptidoglycan DD-metalloendopeptidase family protein [Rikenellaceae bacterium]|nr:peptidoglycan DD-metalloendopeptidase family protein [Rikenellaceae bacterium]